MSPETHSGCVRSDPAQVCIVTSPSFVARTVRRPKWSCGTAFTFSFGLLWVGSASSGRSEAVSGGALRSSRKAKGRCSSES